MNEPVRALQPLGFSEYEARAYAALLRRSPMTGYEIAKTSGIPRSNVYRVLQKLEERGAVTRVQIDAGVRYAPISPAELIERLEGQFRQVTRSARQVLAEAMMPGEHEYVRNVRGYQPMLQHATGILEAARKDLLIAIWRNEAQALADPLHRTARRGVDMTTLCLTPCNQECPWCRGRIYRYRVAPRSSARWLVFVRDAGELLAGEISTEERTLSVRTSQPLLVELTSWYIRYSIGLAAVLTDLGLRLESLLMPETRAILEAIGPGGPGDSWLEHLNRILGPRGQPPEGDETIDPEGR